MHPTPAGLDVPNQAIAAIWLPRLDPQTIPPEVRRPRQRAGVAHGMPPCPCAMTVETVGRSWCGVFQPNPHQAGQGCLRADRESVLNIRDLRRTPTKRSHRPPPTPRTVRTRPLIVRTSPAGPPLRIDLLPEQAPARHVLALLATSPKPESAIHPNSHPLISREPFVPARFRCSPQMPGNSGKRTRRIL